MAPDKPRRELLEAQARGVAGLLDAAMPDGAGYALLIFDFDPGCELAWISNSNRGELVRALLALVQDLEEYYGAGADGRTPL